MNDVLNDLMTRIFPELSGLKPKLLSRIRERIDQSINQTGQANITQIFEMLKRMSMHRMTKYDLCVEKINGCIDVGDGCWSSTVRC